MSFYLIAVLILILYVKSINYKYVIDDYVRREGYLWNVPTEGQNPAFFDTKPTRTYRMFMIGMHIVNSWIIYMLWGWQASLIFAVHPMSVWGVVWVTGNYYATTAYFTLIAYFFLTQLPTLVGIPVGLVFYLCALHSTVDALTFPFFMTMINPIVGLFTFFPLGIFLSSKRWRTGLKTRLNIIKGKQVEHINWEWKRLFFMTKVMANYIMSFVFPNKLFYFDLWAERVRESKEDWEYYHAPNEEFWIALAICLMTFSVGMAIHPTATLWFFVLMSIHSQFKVLGQPFAQRYLYLPMIGLCVVVGHLFNPQVIVFIAGMLAMKTWTVIPQWKDQETLLTNEATMNPLRGSAHSALAQFYLSRKKLVEYPHWQINHISSHIRRAKMLQPDNWVISMNFCAFLVMIGRVDEAIRENECTLELMEKFCTEREKTGIEGTIKQLEWLRNLRIKAKQEAEKQKKKAEKKKKKR